MTGGGFRVLAALCAVWLAAAMPAAHAEKRVALVIGIDSYPNLKADQQLRKAVNDARALGDTLRTLKYDVTIGENVARLEFDRLWQGFLNRIEPGDVTAFFFSGHGVQLRDGVNYLLPRDVPSAGPNEEAFLKRQSISFADMLRDLRQRGARVSLMILDACRDDPFAAAGRKSVVGARGLIHVDAPEGTFVMFSAGSGQTALDRLSEEDRDPNSVYTRRLVPLLRTPGLTLTEVAERVREEVNALAKTSTLAPNHRQSPAFYHEIIGRFCIAGCEEQGGARSAPDPVAADYGRAERIGSLEGWDAFLAEHGAKSDNFYVKLGRAARAKVAVGIPSGPPAAPPPDRCDGVRAGVGTERRCLRPKDTFKDCSDCPEMVVIPAGRFLMGSPESENGHDNDEGPQHEVRIANAFAAAKFEVTRGEFEKFVRDSGHAPGAKCWTHENEKSEERANRSFRNPGFPQDDRHPAVCVNWDDAKAYVQWLSRKTGHAYRLLTEAEWEYAARAGTTARYHSGNAESGLCSDGNGADRTARDTFTDWTVVDCRDGHVFTAPVGRFRANAFGLHDMHGNASEWLEDCYHEDYKGAPGDGSAWTTGACDSRVLRGGSWSGDARVLRSANRFGGRPDGRIDRLGFRLARTL